MCGVFGTVNCPRAAEMTFVGLHAMQSRAKEYAGMATWDGKKLYRESGRGIAQNVFLEEVLARLYGRNAVGHIRYATVDDDPNQDNAQPIIEEGIAICHNGNLTNTKRCRCQLGKDCPWKTSMDTEIILKRFCQSKETDPIKRTFEAIKGVEGTYSLLISYRDLVIAVRDPWGNRPLSLGRKDGGWFMASETVAFQNLDIETVREIEPGEILVISKEGLTSTYFNEERLSDKPLPHKLAKCIFELLYYSHPASSIFGIPVVEFRLSAGKKLRQCCPSTGEVVLEIPDSSKFHAMGYAEADPPLKHVPGLLRSHYIGRTFVEGLQAIRISKAKLKFTALSYFTANKIIDLIDDSVVRLTTLPVVSTLLQLAGAKEIHVRVPTPPIKYPCHYGIDTPTRKELIASDHTVEEIRAEANVDSLRFLTVEQLKELVPDPQNYCFACMTGEYPIPISDYREGTAA